MYRQGSAAGNRVANDRSAHQLSTTDRLVSRNTAGRDSLAATETHGGATRHTTALYRQGTAAGNRVADDRSAHQLSATDRLVSGSTACVHKLGATHTHGRTTHNAAVLDNLQTTACHGIADGRSDNSVVATDRLISRQAACGHDFSTTGADRRPARHTTAL